jgi:hypothetical protein
LVNGGSNKVVNIASMKMMKTGTVAELFPHHYGFWWLLDSDGSIFLVIARSGSDEAIQLSASARQSWIASRSLSSGARSRDPLARNDGG